MAAQLQTDAFMSEIENDVNSSFTPNFVLAGDDVTSLIMASSTNQISIGFGLAQENNLVICSCSGVLRRKGDSYYFIDLAIKRYIPKTGDQIVGIIEEKGSDFYRVNIFSGASAQLNRLNFEGASKRNKPELKVGDVVYCRVSFAHKDIDTELSCISNSGVKKDWSSGETIYGELPLGLTIKTTTKYAKELLQPSAHVLNLLGRHFAYEVCVGMNGLIWIKSNSVIDTVLIRNAIINSELLDNYHIEAMVEILVEKLKKN